MEELKADPEAERTVLEARARHTGHTGDKTEMRNPALGEAAGQAIYAVHGGTVRRDSNGNEIDVAKSLWTTYKGCSDAYRRYLSVCIGASVHAKTAKLEMLPERFEVEESLHYDDRSDDERHRHAADKWGEWKVALDAIGLGHSSEIFSAMHGWGELVDNGTVTKAGKRFVEAVETLEKESE
ncbi:hypothetical protein PVV74_17280 [Roseovarius sp. SK2]|uniref:hypothetical protein n=1 Tax=Roseovarius TaxID=74030 RepID=UPI00237BB1D5|nr:hypothetical protein [Roseovarius sp. SK2]MDD9727216.1 hypothetical protein [Roseovarius sp. SK2]